MRIVKRPKDNGPIHIPLWMVSADAIAPCPCGRPISQGMPHVVVEGETGLKRAFHQGCWMMAMSDDDDE